MNAELLKNRLAELINNMESTIKEERGAPMFRAPPRLMQDILDCIKIIYHDLQDSESSDIRAICENCGGAVWVDGEGGAYICQNCKRVSQD